MHSIGTIQDEQQRRVFAAYLRKKAIEHQLLPTETGEQFIIVDEAKLEKAKAYFQEFTMDPVAWRKKQALAEKRRLKEHRIDRYHRRMDRAAKYWGSLTFRSMPLTATLMILCIVVGIWTNLGDVSSPEASARVSSLIYSQRPIAPISPEAMQEPGKAKRVPYNIIDGEFWRVLTPIFLHFGPVHLLFNMYMLHGLGGIVESRRGWVWLISFVVLVAFISNTLQFFFPTILNLYPTLHNPGIFGGMSGVIYGLFGYLVIKTQFSPEKWLFLPMDLIGMLLIWLLMCLLGALGNIANTAHVSGFLVGCLVGIAPKFTQLGQRLVQNGVSLTK